MARRSRSPWMGAVVLTAANTPYQLSALLDALTNSPTKGPQSGIYRATALAFFVFTGAATVTVGNDDVSATNGGLQLVGSQGGPPVPLAGGGLNLINLNDIYLFSNTASTSVGVTLVTR